MSLREVRTCGRGSLGFNAVLHENFVLDEKLNIEMRHMKNFLLIQLKFNIRTVALACFGYKFSMFSKISC